MRITFKKISAIATSALMIGLTAGTAAAANYPAPFVENGVGNVAVVYGANANPLDGTQAGSILTDLQSSMTATGGSTSVSGGDSVLLEKSSDKFNLGDSANNVFVTSIDDEDMSNLLADGVYTDDENTEYEYTQKIALGSHLNLTHFSDSDYKEKEPTIGIRLADNTHVFNYTLDFTTNPLFNDSQLETSDMVLMGKNYYILDVINSSTAGADKLTLLDSANTAIITEGETSTVDGRTISIAYISSSEVKLTVDGTTTNSLGEGGTYKLSDGTYVGIKDIMYNAKDTGISSVEISLGTGKLEILDGSEIELNDDTVEEIVGFLNIDSSAKLDKVILQWTTDDEAFITPGNDLLMPGFEAVKISMGGMTFPTAEETTVDYSGSDVIELKTTIKDGAVTIPLLQTNSTGEFQLLGKDSSNRLVTNATTSVFFNQTAGDKYIVASWNSSTEAESYYLKVDFITESDVNKIRFTNEVTGDVKKATNNSDVSFGSVVLTAGNIVRDGSNKWSNISINSGGSFNTLYTKEGLKVYLPFLANSTATTEGLIQYNITNSSVLGHYAYLQNYYANISLGATAGHGYDSFYLYFAEEDKDGNLAAGRKFNVTLNDASDKVTVSTVDIGSTSGTYGYEIDDTDNYESYAPTDLATKMLYKTGGDQDSVVITYAGDQAYADVYITSPETTVTAGGTLGGMVVTDAEVASVKNNNLIVVGGSCINSAAASLLGGAYCEGDFTTATGVGSGEFLIKGFASSSVTSKHALLVAGYEVADTANAATYLMNQVVDTSKEYKGTSATSATMVVTTA